MERMIMALICNVSRPEEPLPPDALEHRNSAARWDDLYRINEGFIESGSAYFSQAFAETLGLVSDIELHDLEQGQLRFACIRELLGHSMEQYKTCLELDERSGLGDHHEARLRSLGLDMRGTQE